MRNFPLQRNLILAGLALLFVAVATLAYLTVRMSGSREQRQQALAAETLRLKLVTADVNRASEIRKNIPDVLKRLDEFENSLLPSTQGYSVVTKELDEFAQQTHIAKESVKFHEQSVSGHNLTELGLEVVVDGEYNGIVQYLNKLQRSKTVYIVDGLAVESANTGQGPVGTLKVNLHLRTYFRKA
jgi:type IV pilus assembly protein PilO